MTKAEEHKALSKACGNAPTCKGTMKIHDTHTICSTCRKAKRPAEKSMAEIQADAKQKQYDREHFQGMKNMTLTDPRAASVQRDIAWMYR